MDVRRRLLLSLALSLAVGLPSGRADEAPSQGSDTRREAGIPYRTEADLSDYARQQCQLDLSVPTGAKDFATVVWFHGGGLTGGKRSIPAELERQGIGVVAAGYRLSPEAKSPEHVQDAAAAIAWTFKNISRYGGTPDRVFVAGHSAGAYLVTMVALDKRWLAAHELDANQIAGVISLSGQAITHFTIRKERGIGDRTPVVDEMAPLFHVRKDAPPMLLVTGDRDLEMIGRYEENAYFWRMMKEVGHTRTTLHELDGFNHGEMSRPAYPLLVRFVKKPPQ